MGVENFIPKKWDTGIQFSLRKALVLGALTNRQYEGQLSNGSKLQINQAGTITVNSYTRDSSITYENPDSASMELLVDQQKYWAFQIDDLDKVQANRQLMADYAQEAAYQVSDTIDTFIAGAYSEAGLSVSAATVSAGNALVNLSNFQLSMDEGNVPSQGRYFVTRPWHIQDLVQAATGVVGHTGVPKVFNGTPLATGFVGTLNGFTLLQSNNITYSSYYYPMAFTRDAIAFVMQYMGTEAKRLDSYFATGMRGLYLYGKKVTRPDKLCTCTVTQG